MAIQTTARGILDFLQGNDGLVKDIGDTAKDAGALLDAYDSRSNGLTFCVGSYGSRGDNDIVGMISAFAPRITSMGSTAAGSV